MNPEIYEMKETTLDNYRIGLRKDRFILGMTYMLQSTIPPENIHAIFETLTGIQAGGHD